MLAEGVQILRRQCAIQQLGGGCDDGLEYKSGVMPIEINDGIYQGILISGGISDICGQLSGGKPVI